jgi:hypothetical protein
MLETQVRALEAVPVALESQIAPPALLVLEAVQGVQGPLEEMGLLHHHLIPMGQEIRGLMEHLEMLEPLEPLVPQAIQGQGLQG